VSFGRGATSGGSDEKTDIVHPIKKAAKKRGKSAAEKKAFSSNPALRGEIVGRTPRKRGKRR